MGGLDGWIEGQMGGWVGGSMDGWTDGQMGRTGPTCCPIPGSPLSSRATAPLSSPAGLGQSWVAPPQTAPRPATSWGQAARGTGTVPAPPRPPCPGLVQAQASLAPDARAGASSSPAHAQGVPGSPEELNINGDIGVTLAERAAPLRLSHPPHRGAGETEAQGWLLSPRDRPWASAGPPCPRRVSKG